jgi:hypothetical protein
LAARARTRLFGLIAMPNGALRAPPPCPSQLRCFLSVELGPPRSRAFFFPQEHRGYEIWGQPAPRIAYRSFADPSGNILGSKLCTGATKRPNFFWFFFSIVFGSFLFIILFPFFSPFQFLLILLFWFFSSYLFLFFVFFFFSSYILNCLLIYRHVY